MKNPRMLKPWPLLLLLLILWSAPRTRGAESVLEMLRSKTQYQVEDIKHQLDATPPAELNTEADEEGRSALFFCRHQVATLLLLAGADPNARAHDGRTPAFRVVSQSRDAAFPTMLELLALAHADLNARDNDGYTLLAWAAHEGNLPVVKLLLLLGADPAPGDVPGERAPLFFALQAHDDKMAEALQSAASGAEARRKNAGASPNESLFAAVQAARLHAVSDALAAGADINARNEKGSTALFRAVSDRRAEAVALLLLSGADPNAARDDGRTPLMQCANTYDMASERILMELILAGADVNATAKDGTTPLSQAVHARNNTAAQWFIWRGASLDVHSPHGSLMQGASLNADWPSMIALLKRAGLKEEVSPLSLVKGYSLFEAVKKGDLEAVKAELDKGTPADVTNRYDQTPLEWAICYDQFGIADLLLSRGANINHQHKYNGEHILHQMGGWTRAISANSPKLIEQTLKRGANPNLLMKDGCTPLMCAARNGVTGAALDLLLQATADINLRNKEGLSALALARQHGYTEVAKALQARGAVE